MCACINLTLPTIPSIPTFGVNPALAPLPIPTLNINFCCKFQFSIPFLDEIIAALNAAIAIALAPLNATLFVLTTVVNTIIAAANSVLMSLSLQLNCPLNGTVSVSF